MSQMKEPEASKMYLLKCGNWPRWPFCPVKRYNKKEYLPECGIVTDIAPLSDKQHPNGKCEPVVRILNLFIGWTGEEYNSAKKYEYESLDAMLADGWVVD